MDTTTMSPNTDQREAPAPKPAHRVGADVALGLGLLTLVVVAKLAWALSDGSVASALGLG